MAQDHLGPTWPCMGLLIGALWGRASWNPGLAARVAAPLPAVADAVLQRRGVLQVQDQRPPLWGRFADSVLPSISPLRNF